MNEKYANVNFWIMKPQRSEVRQFFVTFLGWLSDPFQWLSDLQLGDKKVALNHLAKLTIWEAPKTLVVWVGSVSPISFCRADFVLRFQLGIPICSRWTDFCAGRASGKGDWREYSREESPTYDINTNKYQQKYQVNQFNQMFSMVVSCSEKRVCSSWHPSCQG